MPSISDDWTERQKMKELKFAQLFEFEDNGGDRFRFSQFCDRDDEGEL